MAAPVMLRKNLLSELHGDSNLTTPMIERKLVGQLSYFATDVEEYRFVSAMVERFCDPARDQTHLRLLHTARGERWCADANAGRLKRRVGIVRNRILVNRDAGLAKRGFSFRAKHAARRAAAENIDQ